MTAKDFRVRVGATKNSPAHWQLIARDAEPVPGTDFRLKLPDRNWASVVPRDATSARPLFLKTDEGWQLVCWLAPGSQFTYPDTISASQPVVIRSINDPWDGIIPAWHFASDFTAFHGEILGPGFTMNMSPQELRGTYLGRMQPTGIIDYRFIKNNVIGDRQVKAADLVVSATAGDFLSFREYYSTGTPKLLIDIDQLSANMQLTLIRMRPNLLTQRLVRLTPTAPARPYLVPQLAAMPSGTDTATVSIHRGFRDIHVYSTSVTDTLNAIPYGQLDSAPYDAPSQWECFSAQLDWPDDLPPLASMLDSQARIWQMWATLKFELRVIL